MILLRILLSLTVIGSATLVAENAGLEREEWMELEAEALPPEWAALSEQVASRPWATADFIEERHFSFRRRPVELHGTVWFGREEGLTLAYKAPREEMMRVNEAGARMIKNGRVEDSKIPKRGRDVPDVLLALFRLDFAELEKTFKIEGRRNGENWSLRMTPRDEDRAPIQRMELNGRKEEIRRIEIGQTRSRWIELELSNIVYPNSLDTEQRARLFP